jgi:hypothetical protein
MAFGLFGGGVWQITTTSRDDRRRRFPVAAWVTCHAQQNGYRSPQAWQWLCPCRPAPGANGRVR